MITAFLGKTQDRFSEYQEPTSLRERLEMVHTLPGYDGVEVVYPYETGEAKETAGWMNELELQWAAVNANIKKEPAFVPGALSRPSPDIRRAAVEIVKEAKDFATEVNAPLVTVCPLADGYDNLFQIDYTKAWKRMIDSLGEAAAHRPEMPLFIEYKFSETRAHCLLDSVDRTLLAIRDLQSKNVGVTIDFGHALYSQENPAQSIALVAESGFDFYLHTNDNDARFDWDLVSGTRHFLHYAEFLFYAIEYGYSKYFTTDASPRIFDMKGFFTRHSEISQGLYQLVSQLDRKGFRELMEKEDAIELMKRVNTEIYRLPALSDE